MKTEQQNRSRLEEEREHNTLSGDRDMLERKGVGPIVSSGMQTFLCSLPHIYGPCGSACWLLLLHRSLSPSAQEEIHCQREYPRAGAFSEPWVAVAPIELGLREGRSLFKDNTVMSLLRHVEQCYGPNWALWTDLHKKWICVVVTWSSV